MSFIGYDIETEGDEEGFALQPWRVHEKSARITMVSAWKNGHGFVQTENFQDLLNVLKESRQQIALWNGVFDLSWLYASGYDIANIRWYDAMLLWKWLENGQRAPMKWDLASGAERFLPDWDKLEEFLEIKEMSIEPGQDSEYWRDRVTLDAEATARIADIIWGQLTSKQKISSSIQAMTMPTIAASWVNGIHIDLGKIKDSELGIINEMYSIEKKLGLEEPWIDEYVPAKILRSPKKLANLVYNDWGYKCTRFSEKTKAPSADKIALTYLTDYNDERIFDILRWRELNTIWSKFVTGPIKTCEYLKSNVTHSSPKIFSTYTGRMTYSSSPRKGKGIRYGLPIHQTPRNKDVRKGIVAPSGEYIFEADAKGQEMRFMAVQSKDERMIELFNADSPFDDSHSLVGSQLINIDFKDFLERKAAKDLEIVGPQGARNAGKYVALSNLYRASDRTLMIRGRVNYGFNIEQQTAKIWKQKFLNLFPGIKDWWMTAPSRTKRAGYAETLGGRRYGVSKWGKDWQWASSSSAINFPIQGTGADQRDLAIATIATEHPDLKYKFYFDLHDGLYITMPKKYKFKKAQDVIRSLNNIDYKKFWGVDIPIPLLWDGSFGPTWGSKIDVSLDEKFDGTLEEFYNLGL